MPKADITVEIPPLPEGWQGTPDQFLEFIKDNAIFNFDGDFPTGQIGGSRPEEDIGIWYGDNAIEKYDEKAGEYVPISDVPIGCLLPLATNGTNIPANYLLADGRSLLRADYPALFAVIGTLWGTESGTTFNLPDLRGRFPIGAGIGDYKYQGIIGRMLELIAGTYIGFEWPKKITSFFANAPTKSMTALNPSTATKYWLSIQSPAVVVPYIIRYR